MNSAQLEHGCWPLHLIFLRRQSSQARVVLRRLLFLGTDNPVGVVVEITVGEVVVLVLMTYGDESVEPVSWRRD